MYALHVHGSSPSESCDISVIISYGRRIASVCRNHLFRKMVQFCLPRMGEQAQYLRGYNLNKGSLCNTVYLFGHTYPCPSYTMPMRNVTQFLLNVPAPNGRVDSRAAPQKRIIFCGHGQKQCSISPTIVDISRLGQNFPFLRGSRCASNACLFIARARRAECWRNASATPKIIMIVVVARASVILEVLIINSWI